MGQSLAIPRVISNDWKRLDLIVSKIKMRLGSASSPTFTGVTISGLTASTLVGANALKLLESVTVGTGLDYTRPNLTLSHLGIEALTDPGADKILFWDDTASACKWLGVGNSIVITDVTIDTIQDIRTSASPTFVGLTLSTIAAEATDVDKFLVDSTGVIKYRTGAQVLSDIGGQASDAGLTSLAGLVYVSDSFIKVTATDTYAIRTITETKTDLSLNLVENTALSTWAGTTNITTLGTITTVGNITIANGGTIGQAAGPLLTFDDTNNILGVTGCKVGIGTVTPLAVSTLEVYGNGADVSLVVHEDAGTHEAILRLRRGATDYEIINAGNLVFEYETNEIFKIMSTGVIFTQGSIKLKEQAAADGDTAAYGQIWVKNTAPCTPWFIDDAGNDGQFMLMRSASINADSDAADVQGCNVLWVDTSGGDVVLGGLANGVDNQLLYVFKYGEANILTIEHQEGTGTQKFMMNGADIVNNGVGICLPFICKNGTWYIAAYPRSFSA